MKGEFQHRRLYLNIRECEVCPCTTLMQYSPKWGAFPPGVHKTICWKEEDGFYTIIMKIYPQSLFNFYLILF